MGKTTASEVWLPRTVKVTLGGAGSVDLTLGKLVTALGNAGSVAVKVLALKVWNFTNQATSTNYLKVTVQGNSTTNSVGTEGEDFGCSSSLPGVKVNIPDLLSKTNSGDTTSTTALASATGSVNGSTVAQQILFEVQCLVRV